MNPPRVTWERPLEPRKVQPRVGWPSPAAFGMLPRMSLTRSYARILAVPRLALQCVPGVAVVVLLKLAFVQADLQPLDANPLLSGLVAAMVFLLGFLLAGTAADYKEAERLPGEIAASLDTIADECLVVHAEKGIPAAADTVAALRSLARAIPDWLQHRKEFDDVLAEVRGLNAPFLVFTPITLPGFVTRLKSEQAFLRKTLIRIDAIRTTSFVAAGYAIAELTGTLLLVGLLLSDIGELGESLFFTGVIALLMTYLFLLVRDLDDPFGYAKGEEGVADVSLKPLEDVARRLDREHARLVSAAPSA